MSPPAAPTGDAPVSIARTLARDVRDLRFSPPVTHVYHPLDYAFDAHRQYLEHHCRPGVEALLVGMNPGPFGMVQTGVPFGEVSLVREWLRIDTGVEPPPVQHPKRPVQGFACTRSEISGKRLWGWARDRFGTPDAFFRRFFVWNYCPLAFLEASGRNRTPDKLPAAERQPLYRACDRALAAIVAHLAPRRIVGIGRWSEARARALFGDGIPVGHILHPSPASPLANRGWPDAAEAQLRALGVTIV